MHNRHPSHTTHHPTRRVMFCFGFVSFEWRTCVHKSKNNSSWRKCYAWKASKCQRKASLYSTFTECIFPAPVGKIPPEREEALHSGWAWTRRPQKLLSKWPKEFFIFLSRCLYRAVCPWHTPTTLHRQCPPPPPSPGVQAAEAAARTRNQTASTLAIRVSFELIRTLAQNRFWNRVVLSTLRVSLSIQSLAGSIAINALWSQERNENIAGNNTTTATDIFYILLSNPRRFE